MKNDQIKKLIEVEREWYMRVRLSVLKDLEAHWKTWQRPLTTAQLLKPYISTIRHNVGFTLNEFLAVLEDNGDIKVVTTIDNKKFIFLALIYKSQGADKCLDVVLECVKERSIMNLNRKKALNAFK